MSKQTSFGYQKQLLEEFKRYLLSFNDELSGLVRQYETQLYNFYDQEGLMEEIYEEYKEIYLNPTQQKIKELTDRIESEDLAFVDKEIDFLSSR